MSKDTCRSMRPDGRRLSIVSAAALPLLFAFACTGQVGDAGGPGAGPGQPGEPGRPTPGGPSAPIAPPGTPAAALGPLVSAPGVSTRFSRLTHEQWENTVRDLLHLPASAGLSTQFVAEPLRSSFDTNGGILTVSSDLWSDYQGAAENIARRVSRDANLLRGLQANPPADAAARARGFVESVGLRAFRRPLTDGEMTRYLGLFNKGAALIGSADAFADGVELVLSAMLQSPHFLYRSETSGAVVSGKIPLNDYEMASRLSYGLQSTMPDDALLAAAGAKKLSNNEGLLEQARRLLDTPAAQETIADFHNQLLRIRDYEPVKKTSPLFPAGVGADLKNETLSFIKDAVGQGRGLTDLLTAPYTFANSRIARMYGLPGVMTPAMGRPDPFVKVDLDPTQRAGFLTQIGFLAANGEEELPNTIMRGVRIAFDVLCLDLPPPPDAIPPLPALAPNTTNRQRVQELTKNAPCNSCHGTVINPLGFAFESLDGLGRFRTVDNGQPVDAMGTYEIDGMSFPYNGAVDLVKAISGTKQAHDCYSRRWVEYVYGRELDMNNMADKNLVTQAGLRSKAKMSVKDLILNVIVTDAFTSRLP